MKVQHCTSRKKGRKRGARRGVRSEIGDDEVERQNGAAGATFLVGYCCTAVALVIAVVE